MQGGGETPPPTVSGVQDITLIPERDVYRLVMRFKLPAAEQFEEWVVGTVLPALRNSGRNPRKDPTHRRGGPHRAAVRAELAARRQLLGDRVEARIGT